MKKAIGYIMSIIMGATMGAVAVYYFFGKKVSKQKEVSDKHLELYLLMNQWVKIKQNNQSIVKYLEAKGYNKIAIYGMNYVGETLLNELEGTNVKVAYAIDKNAEKIIANIDIVSPEANFKQVDAVIVTPITYFDEIEEHISTKIDCPILSIQDILYEL